MEKNGRMDSLDEKDWKNIRKSASTSPSVREEIKKKSDNKKKVSDGNNNSR